MKYHASSCYRRFQLDMGKIVSLVQPSVELSDSLQQGQEPTDTNEQPEPHQPLEDSCGQRSKRFKPNEAKKICIFCATECKTIKQKKVHTLYRICEKPMAQKLLNAAMLFKDRVYTETAGMSGVDAVFAADMFYHDYCCKAYFNKYQAKIAEIMTNLEMEYSVAAADDSFKARFQALQLDFTNSAYSLSSIRDRLNEGSADVVSNRSVKHLIIELYGDAVCFTYPSNKQKSQMVLGTNSSPQPLVESLRVSPAQKVATELAQELKKYSFGLKTSLCEPHDLQLSMDKFQNNPPPLWAEFCSYMFKGKTTATLKVNVVFQILHYILTDGTEPTPFHVMVGQGVHSLTRSKELVTALCQHGVSVSYNTVRKIDVDLAEQIITTAGDNRVPLPAILEKTSPLNGAMDNFDRNESTLAGTGSSHDTILILFQNVPLVREKPPQESEISVRSILTQSRTTVKLRSKVSCQQLVWMGALTERGEVPDSYEVRNFIPPGLTSSTDDDEQDDDEQMQVSSPEAAGTSLTTFTDDDDAMLAFAPEAASTASSESSFITSDYFLWTVNRYSKKTAAPDSDYDSDFVPGFTAARSTTVNCKFHPTTTVLTPILPYPATTYDAILTTMINFQDALKQKGDAYGALWADEGVYRIAKEIQLLRPEQFKNIFLGLGGFHMEKIVLACLGAYLEPSGIFTVLVETECYGTDVIKTVISGSHYSRARTAHSMIHEVLTSMMLDSFLSKFPEKQKELAALHVDFQSQELTVEEWKTAKEDGSAVQAAFEVYLNERASQSQSFNYWKMYVSDLLPIIRDLTNSLRSGDWNLYVSAVERATSLFFFFGRTNYCRWTPLFLQDCYQLKDKFPLLYESYMNGGFVVNTTRKGSGVPFDQALEQCYNRPAKVSGGIIGVTRKKDAVALWGIIKHKKDQYVDLLKKRMDVPGELSLHHDFNPSTAATIVKMVQDIEEYLLKVCNPLQDQAALKNILTGETVTSMNIDRLICCMKEGHEACANFINDRLRKKLASIHSTISKIKFTSPKAMSNLTSKVDVKSETIKALMFLEYGCHRGFAVEELLQHEVTKSALFLVDKDGYLRKSAKSQLGTELLKLCPHIDKKSLTTAPRAHAIVIDFMALVRKVPLKKLDPPVKTFHDFAVALTSVITKAGHASDEIHIVFDTYKEDSIKNGERNRRAKSKEMVVLDVILPNQKVPVVLDNFWSSSTSKTAFQAFYVEWLTTNYHDSKPLYLGISPQAWLVSTGSASSFPRLNCTHEEADDRMMFHVQDIVSHHSEPISVTLSSGDTDVFVSLLYHFTVIWRDLGLRELWLIRNSGVRRSILPLHDICSALGNDLIKCLPAVHSLTGCDTTSKIATKYAALKAVQKPENSSLLLDFNSPRLTESIIEMAETFLVKCLKPVTDLETFDDLRVAAFSSNALKMDFEKTACTSTNAKKHIQRAYYQLQLWIQAPFRDATLLMNAEAYGFKRRDNLLVPDIVISKPEGLPDPCTCGKCARNNSCRCRAAGIKCCKYCKCKGGTCCQNPITQ